MQRSCGASLASLPPLASVAASTVWRNALPGCTGALAAVAAARCRLPPAAAAALPYLPVAAAAQQLISLRSFRCGSFTALQHTPAAEQPAAARQQQPGDVRSFHSSAPASLQCRTLPSAAQQLLASLRGNRDSSGLGRRAWGGLRYDGHSLHSSRTAAALGVVDKLHDAAPVVMTASHQRHLWEVLEFRPDATCVETWKSPDVLGLHPRDVYLFASDVGVGQRAMLAPRSSAILLRTDVCKAVVYMDKAVLFPSRRLSDTIRISQSIKAAVTQKSPLPFELKVLEALLSETSRAYENKSKRLAIVAETVLADINANFHSSAGELQRLIPIQRKLTEVQNDVQEVLDAIGDVVNDDTEVKKLCLTERLARTAAAAAAAKAGEARLPPQLASNGGRTPEMRMGAAILESYEFKLQGTYTALKEVLENIEQTRTVWHMQLDHQRNRVLRVNLLISILSLGAVSATLPAAFFGMNLSSGLEEVAGVFWPVVQSSLLFGMCSAGLMYGYYRIGPKRRYKARLRDMRSLRDLLIFHLDDLDDIMESVKERARRGTAVSKKEFQNIVKQAVRGKPMSKDEVELLYRVFDTNKDGFLELSELVRVQEHVDDEFASTHF